MIVHSLEEQHTEKWVQVNFSGPLNNVCALGQYL